MSRTLSHHGIKGQKWGIRRFQNEDGSLTPEGERRYGKMSSRKLYKTLTKEYKAYRKTNGEGKHVKDLRKENVNRRKEWKNSKPYKDWNRQLFEKEKQLDAAHKKGDSKEFRRLHKEYDELSNRRPKSNELDIRPTKYNGKLKGGKDLTIAMLEDLGYNKKVARKFDSRMRKKGYVLSKLYGYDSVVDFSSRSKRER